MKNIVVACVIVVTCVMVGCMLTQAKSGVTPLQQAPERVEQFNEIAAQYDTHIADLFNQLSPAERVFSYYMLRAALPGNLIVADQQHRHAREMIDLFKALYAARDHVGGMPFNKHLFFDQVQTFLVYLLTNHGPYFVKEHSKEKRTPALLGLDLITQAHVARVLKDLERPDLQELLERVASTLFDADAEPTCCVPDSIERSGGNFYSSDFTEEDYRSLPAEQQTKINAYFYAQQIEGKRVAIMQPCCVGGKYDQELGVAAYWLRKAHAVAAGHATHFDASLVKSLEYLIAFIETGDEELFKQHSIEWTKSNSRIDYLFGFIETYQDPKMYRGSFAAEVTIKAVEMNELNAALPAIEELLPFAREYKRDLSRGDSALPNASINVKLFGTGDQGPLQITAAYCLPNYPELRSACGSKQIIYQVGKGLGELMNPALYRALFNSSDQEQWLLKHDLEGHLHRDVWAVHCILHETLGHGSGQLHQHVFTEKDDLTVAGVTYKVGDVVAVTSDNINEFLAGYHAALEELRAEIIALYTSIESFDELARLGLYKEWPNKIGKDALIQQLIIDMCWTGLRRLISQPYDEQEILGAHAQANVTLMNYLLDAGGIRLVQEEKKIDGVSYQVLGFAIDNVERVCATIKELAQRVQRIKSTANRLDCVALIDTYGRYVRTMDHVRILKHNYQAVVGALKVSATVFPTMQPIVGENNKIVDVQAVWPAGLVEQQLQYEKIALMTE